MNVLVLGSGGRENAIAWKIKQSSLCDSLFCMPGNPGTAYVATNLTGSANDFSAVRKAVLDNGIGMVVVGPEDPLVNGIRDYFLSDAELKDILFIGPGSKGAMLEGSKDFAKEFMYRHNIPTARYRSFRKESIEQAYAFLETLKSPYVLKADGLAAGKGVLIINDIEEARRELRNIMDGKFGSAGDTVVIEEFLSGIEVSVFVLTDGKDYLVLPEAKDYKRIGVGDTGLNTGGMGAVSPVKFADMEFMAKVEERIIKPTVNALHEEGIDYRGFIFIGLMNCGGDPYVIEYNVRMGDPETEAVMTRISSDLLHHLVAAAKGEISGEEIEISRDTALTVVCVSGGYPQSYGKGFEIKMADPFAETISMGDITVFHAGTAIAGSKLVTSGGRVLAVTANGSSIEDCREKAYEVAENISFKDKYYRNDIGLDLLRF